MKRYSEKKILENFKGFTVAGIAYSLIDGLPVFWAYCSGYGDNFTLVESRRDATRIKYGYAYWYEFRVDEIGSVCKCRRALDDYERACKDYFRRMKEE